METESLRSAVRRLETQERQWSKFQSESKSKGRRPMTQLKDSQRKRILYYPAFYSVLTLNGLDESPPPTVERAICMGWMGPPTTVERAICVDWMSPPPHRGEGSLHGWDESPTTVEKAICST